MEEILHQLMGVYPIIYKVVYTSQVAQDVFHPQHVSSSTSPQKIQQAFSTKPQPFSLSTPQKNHIHTPEN